MLPRLWPALLWLQAAAAVAAPFGFAALGDAPYHWGEREAMARMLDALAPGDLAFAVHIGDLKSGHSDCSDATYSDRLKLLDAAPLPLVYLPGDNDWTDCSRWDSGSWVPEERLAKLRTTFFGADESLGRVRLPLERQRKAQAGGCCPENARWWREGIPFATVHVVGSANNRGTDAEPRPEYVTRTAANVEWLRETFRLARERGAPGVALFIHANAGIERIGRFRPEYAPVLDVLVEETVAFSKPVLLVHGDTHRFQLNRPWSRVEGREGIPHLLRLETPGSPAVAWVPVQVDPASPDVFTVAAPRTAPAAPR